MTLFFVTHALPPRAPVARAAPRRAPATTCTAPPPPSTSPPPPSPSPPPKRVSPPKRARCPPKRPIDSHELKLLKIQPSQISATDDSSQQAIFSALVGVCAAAVLVPPLFSPPPQVATGVTGVAALAMAAWALDALQLEGALQKAGWLALQSRRRVARHEAAHILVAHLLCMRVQRFEMPSVLRALRGRAGGAVVSHRGADAYDTCAVAVAGTVAELRAFGDARGGVDDVEKALRVGGRWSVVYWGVVAADLLLKEHARALDALVEELVAGRCELPALLRLVDQHRA